MKVIAEIGTAWLPGTHPLRDAVKAAFDCGADLVKVQFWQDDGISRRRNGAKLDTWKLSCAELLDLADQFPSRIGASAFIPWDLEMLKGVCLNRDGCPLAFIKSATQEYQYAALAHSMSVFSYVHHVPLYVSVPHDGCLVVGNYGSPLPITWLYCEPSYPAEYWDYSHYRTEKMRRRLPGMVGLSDHTVDAHLLGMLLRSKCQDGAGIRLDAVEKHFCYDESLRDKVPDGGSWSLSPKAFTEYVKIARGA